MTHPRTEQRMTALRNGESAITTEEAERRMNEKALMEGINQMGDDGET